MVGGGGGEEERRLRDCDGKGEVRREGEVGVGIAEGAGGREYDI